MENIILAAICAAVTVSLTIALLYCKIKGRDKSHYMFLVLAIILWSASTVEWIWRAYHGL